MKHNGLPARQLCLWLFAAMVPVGISFCAGAWLWVTVAAGICGLCGWIAWRWGRWECRWAWVVRYGILVLMLGRLARGAEGSWPGSEHIAVPLILLTLAAWSAGKGLHAAARVGCVLYWFVLIGYGVVLVAGLKEVRFSWLRPVWTRPQWDVVPVLLMPALASFLRKSEDGWNGKLLLPSVFMIVAAAVTAAVLSPSMALHSDNGFYEMCRSLEIFGVAKRFEAVVSALMTVGWFALLSLMLAVCGQISKETGKWSEKVGVYVAAVAVAGMLLCKVHISVVFVAVAVTIFWVLIPILEQGIGAEKKS